MFHFGLMLKDYLEYHKITQSDFADRLGISQKHMNKIINGSTNISPELMLSISLLTGIDVNLIFAIEQEKRVFNNLISICNDEKGIKKYLNNFYIKELNERKWINFLDYSSSSSNAVDLLKFMNTKDFESYKTYLEKRVAFKKLEHADLLKAFLWVRHCEILTEMIEVCEYNSKRLNYLFDELNEESKKKFNEESIINILAKYGIILCVEDALKGTKVRGASLVKGKTPYIFLTKYFKEKSSFYFALYHELAHIKRDYNMLQSKIYIDSKDNEIDEYALDKMIDTKTWNNILIDFENRERDFYNYNISESFIFSRLVYEGRIKYNSKLYQSNIEII